MTAWRTATLALALIPWLAACAVSDQRPESAEAVGALSAEAGIRLALASRAGGDLTSAVSALRTLAESHPRSLEVALGLGDTLFEAHAYDEAQAAYQRARTLAPDQPGPLVGLGRVALARRQPAEALALLQQALALAPDHVGALNVAGVAQEYLGHSREAQEHFRRGLTLDPGNRTLKNNLALSLALSRHQQAALALLRDEGQTSFRLVLCGSNRGAERPIEHLVAEFGVSDLVSVLGFVDSTDLGALYRNATALVMPSYFGPTNLPPLEAWSVGTPVVYPQQFEGFVGDAAVLFDYDDVRSLADAIVRVQSPDLRATLREAGARRLREFAAQTEAGRRQFAERMRQLRFRRQA